MAKATSKSTKRGAATNYTIRPLYAVPILEAAASGKLSEMKSTAAKARKHIADVQGALAKLEKAMAKAGK